MSSKVKEIIYASMGQIVSVMNDCFADQKIFPMLMLLYPSIDIMSWLNRDIKHDDGTRKDYMDWVGRFLLPESSLSCSAIDLYSARCAFLHSFSAESNLSRSGKAKRIYYAWGNGNELDLQALINILETQVVTIHVDKLFAAFCLGMDKFINSVDEGSDQERLIVDRSKKLFKLVPAYKLPLHMDERAAPLD